MKSPDYEIYYTYLKRAIKDDDEEGTGRILENYFIKQVHLDQLLNFAIVNDRDATILEILMNAGADPTANGSKALLNAIRLGDVEAVETIMNTYHKFPPEIMRQVELFRQNQSSDCDDEDENEDDEDIIDYLLVALLMD